MTAKSNSHEKDPDKVSQTLCYRVAELRKKQRLTLEQLASASGVSRSMLSQIERGQANPTLAVTYRIAEAFGMTIGELIDQPWMSSSIERVHGDDPNNLFRSDGECTIRTLSPLHIEKKIEFYEVRLTAGAKLMSAPHFEGTKELLTVVSGTAEIHSGDSIVRLSTSDSAHYRADLAHSIVNSGDTELVCYLVVTS